MFKNIKDKRIAELRKDMDKYVLKPIESKTQLSPNVNNNSKFFKEGDKVKFTSNATFFYLLTDEKRYLENKPAYRNIIWTIKKCIEEKSQYILEFESFAIKVYYRSVEKTKEKRGQKTMDFKLGDKVVIKKNVYAASRPDGAYIIFTALMKRWEWEVIRLLKGYQNRLEKLEIIYKDTIVHISPSEVELLEPIHSNQKTNTAFTKNNSNDSGYKFTALGLSGSGKTCYIAGMYYKMTGGFDGYTLKTSDDIDVKLTTIYEKMKNTHAGKDRFPTGTNQISKYIFELQFQYDSIEKFEWIDYDGNCLKLKNNGSTEQYKNLKNDITHSEILYIFVDGVLFDDENLKFAENDKDKIEILADIVKDSCSRQINHFISEYTKENNKLPPIAIIVTKYDIINEVLGKATSSETNKMLQDIIKRAFNPLFPDPTIYNGTLGYTSMVGIIPVSLGATISKNEYKGSLRPINMHLPIYMGIWFMLKKTCDYIRQNNYTTDPKFNSILQKQEAALDKLSQELDECGSQFYINGQTGKFSVLSEAYCKLIKEKNFI